VGRSIQPLQNRQLTICFKNGKEPPVRFAKYGESGKKRTIIIDRSRQRSGFFKVVAAGGMMRLKIFYSFENVNT
jgi:hypothetical protein